MDVPAPETSMPRPSVSESVNAEMSPRVGEEFVFVVELRSIAVEWRAVPEATTVPDGTFLIVAVNAEPFAAL
jgi:hypothetical protein